MHYRRVEVLGRNMTVRIYTQTPLTHSDVAGYWIVCFLKPHRIWTLTTKLSWKSDNDDTRQQTSISSYTVVGGLCNQDEGKMIKNALLYPYAALYLPTCSTSTTIHLQTTLHLEVLVMLEWILGYEAFFTFWSKTMFTHLGSDKRPAPQQLLYVMGGAALQGFGSGEHWGS